MVSFTGSTRAGILVAKAAADTVKRVHQELGGKSANIILPDADLSKSVTNGVRACFMNSGQSCNAPTRMLVQNQHLAQAAALAKAAAEGMKVGDPQAADTALGPVVNKTQFDRILSLIETGIAEGATLVTGGPGRPAGLGAKPPEFQCRVFGDDPVARRRRGGRSITSASAPIARAPASAPKRIRRRPAAAAPPSRPQQVALRPRSCRRGPRAREAMDKEEERAP
jgi:acyl-CoA reductase-like NAD-dependent aldehyde dehydrogenase